MGDRGVQASFYDGEGIADRYSRHRHSGPSSPNHVMEEPAFLDVVGDVANLAILDLGCGDAGFGRTAVQGGCRSYLGVDDSEAMIEQARQVVGGTAARLHRSTIEDLRLPSGSIDLITSRMALHYVEDLGAVLRSCRRWLAPSGRLVMTVVHPVLTSPLAPLPTGSPRTDWTVDDYFTTGARHRTWLGSVVTWQHRTIEGYLALLAASGFTLSDLRECAPRPERFADVDDPELVRRQRVPMFLLLAAVAT